MNKNNTLCTSELQLTPTFAYDSNQNREINEFQGSIGQFEDNKVSANNEPRANNHKFQIPLIQNQVETSFEDDLEEAANTNSKQVLIVESRLNNKSFSEQNQSVNQFEKNLRNQDYQLLPPQTNTPNKQKSRKQIELSEEKFQTHLTYRQLTLLSKRSYDHQHSGIESRPNFNRESYIRKQNLNKAVKKSVGRWSHEERSRFMKAVELYGDNWAMVEEFVGTRNSKQIINYAQKHLGTELSNKINFKPQNSQEEEQKVQQNYSSKKLLTFKKSPLLSALPIIKDEEISKEQIQTNEEELEVYIKDYIELIRKFENLYRFETFIDKDSSTVEQIANQIKIMRDVVGRLIEKNSEKKREAKLARKASYESVEERLKKVIFVDLFSRLNVQSFAQLKQRYNKLSDWVDSTPTYIPQYNNQSCEKGGINHVSLSQLMNDSFEHHEDSSFFSHHQETNQQSSDHTLPQENNSLEAKISSNENYKIVIKLDQIHNSMGSTSLSQTSELDDRDEYFPEIEIEDHQLTRDQKVREHPYKRIKDTHVSHSLSRQSCAI